MRAGVGSGTAATWPSPAPPLDGAATAYTSAIAGRSEVAALPVTSLPSQQHRAAELLRTTPSAALLEIAAPDARPKDVELDA